MISLTFCDTHTTAFLTHAQGDHFGDVIAIASRRGVPLGAIYEISVVAEAEDVEEVGMNVGGSTTVGNTASP